MDLFGLHREILRNLQIVHLLLNKTISRNKSTRALQYDGKFQSSQTGQTGVAQRR